MKIDLSNSEWKLMNRLWQTSPMPITELTAALREDTVDVRQIDLSQAAVIVGSEGRGVSPLALELCEKTIKIPMRARCESLNAGVAASVVLWEMARSGPF